MYKTDALKSLLLKINPYLDIQTDCVKVTEENIVDLLGDELIICEAFDRPEAKAMLVNGVLEKLHTKYLIAADGTIIGKIGNDEQLDSTLAEIFAE